ncbi:MAG: dihydroorotate dehydrogenase electron transfer subunit [Eubacteriales bacterium]|nr:dihydroorotate dehydrogenase electron transfer subunit [Eubacteriales bacterium]
MKKKTEMTVLDSRMLAPDIWSLELAYAPGEAPAPREIRPGQFAGLYPAGGDMLLMRPISICRWDAGRGALRFVYRAAGKGTRSFTLLRPGDHLEMLGILGNGYDLEKFAGKRVVLLGGGIGVPPMLELAAALHGAAAPGGQADPGAQAPASVTAVLGYRDSSLFLREEMEAFADVYIATEDGSVGTKGNVLDVVREKGLEADVLCACGPLPMLRAVKQYAAEKGIRAWLSLEERMACGIGVCLGCVAKTTRVDEHSRVHNARVCVEGPVFPAEDVDI